MGWIGCVCCEKFRCDFEARTFAHAPICVEFRKATKSPKCTRIVWNTPKHQFRVQQGGSSAFIAKNSNATLWHELLHQFDPFCTECCKATKGSQMHPNSMKHTKIWVWGPMGWIRCFSCEKFRCDFLAWTFAPVLSRFAPSFVRHPNSRKKTKTWV